MMRINPPGGSIVRSLRIRYLLPVDLFLMLSAVLLAVALRLESLPDMWAYLEAGGWTLLVLVTFVRLPLYFHLNLYNRLWRYASMADVRSILLAGVLAPLGIAILNFGLLRQLALPYSPSGSIWLLEALCSLALLTSSRLILRVVQQKPRRLANTSRVAPQPTLIIGAGDAGAMVLREIQRNIDLGIKVLGFVDDDTNKHGNILFGVPVLGNRHLIPELVRQHGVKQVIIAMPTAPGKIIREVVKICEEVQIRPRVVPSLHALVHGFSSLSQLRPVEIDDLLRREPIETDIGGVRRLLHNQRILVTGGGGSIGGELCRQILQFAPAELIILGHGENSVFEIEQELRQRMQVSPISTRLTTCIADIRMADRVNAIFSEYRPNVVFHAAAHKHVPLMEANPGEAVTNNILGTGNLLQAAQSTDVERFIMVSTDKAVNPTSVMGACKRAAEMLVIYAAQKTGRPYVTVRFGNVLGSRGSVVLTFKRQIAAGGPVTVTHPDVKRFFMTIPEAVQLLLQAAVLGQGGEIFMLDMGEPVRIVDLARDLIRLSGLEEGRDIDIEFVGMRPGEKMYEDLFLAGEDYHTTIHPKIRIATEAGRFVPLDLAHRVATLAQAAQSDRPEEIRRRLGELVPEYQNVAQKSPTARVFAGPPDRSELVTHSSQDLPVDIIVPRMVHSNGASD